MDPVLYPFFYSHDFIPWEVSYFTSCAQLQWSSKSVNTVNTPKIYGFSTLSKQNLHENTPVKDLCEMTSFMESEVFTSLQLYLYYQAKAKFSTDANFFFGELAHLKLSHLPSQRVSMRNANCL